MRLILFSTDHGTTTEMILLNGGNVGIGTTSPGEKLELGTGGKIKLTSNDNISGSIVVLAGDQEAILSTENDSATGDPFQFVLKHNLGHTELINRRGDLILSASGDVVSPTSRVGIGTASPSYHLHVENADDTQALFKSTDAGPTYVRIDTG